MSGGCTVGIFVGITSVSGCHCEVFAPCIFQWASCQCQVVALCTFSVGTMLVSGGRGCYSLRSSVQSLVGPLRPGTFTLQSDTAGTQQVARALASPCTGNKHQVTSVFSAVL